jgi:hypothetical protein
MHNRYDQFAKNVLRDALSRACDPHTEVEVEVLAATQRIDVYTVPDPARTAGPVGQVQAGPGPALHARRQDGRPGQRRARRGVAVSGGVRLLGPPFVDAPFVNKRTAMSIILSRSAKLCAGRLARRRGTRPGAPALLASATPGDGR